MKKKTWLQHSFQNVHKVQKRFGTMKKTTVKFSPNYEQKQFVTIYLNFWKARPPYTTIFVGDFIPAATHLTRRARIIRHRTVRRKKKC